MSPDVHIRVASPGDDAYRADCDAFAEAHAAGTFYHSTLWSRFLDDRFPLRSFYLVAERDGRVTGVLPLAQQKSVLFGNRLTSLPFSSYGGVLAQDRASLAALLEQAVNLGARLGCDLVELRNHRPEQALAGGPWVIGSRKVTMVVDLDRGADELLTSFSATRRNETRRTQRGDLEYAQGGTELLDLFYRVFSENMRDLGTPVYPKWYFLEMLERFPGRFSLGVVTLGDRVVAGAVVQRWRHIVEMPFASALREHRRLFPSTFLYWNVMAAGREDGATEFDIGRCDVGSGSWAFKRQFGAIEVELPWAQASASGRPPELNKTDSRFGLAIAIWRKLPLGVANALGPPISSRLY